MECKFRPGESDWFRTNQRFPLTMWNVNNFELEVIEQWEDVFSINYVECKYYNKITTTSFIHYSFPLTMWNVNFEDIVEMII